MLTGNNEMEKTNLHDVLEQWGKCTVLLTGATGGTGKIISKILQSSKKIKLIRVSSKAQQNKEIIQCDLVNSEPNIPEQIDYIIHCACTYKRKKDLLMAKNILSFSKKKNVSLLVFFSSWVVHSKNFFVDDYTKFKREIEYLVCNSQLNNYLILRPSIILGGGLIWDKIINYLNNFPLTIPENIIIDPIHVSDVAEITVRLMGNEKSYNKKYDLGTKPITLSQYMKINSYKNPSPKLTKLFFHFIKFMMFPGWKALSKVSSMGFLFDGYAAFDSNKTIQMIPDYKFKEPHLFENINGGLFPENVCQLKEIAQAYPEKIMRGRMGVDILRHNKATNFISTIKMNKILSMDDDFITVEAGTTLKDICEFLLKKGRMLAYLPDYLFISIGACFATPVHGSSSDYGSFLEILTTYQYLDKETFQLHCTDDKTLDRNTMIIIQATLRHQRAYLCEKKINFESDIILDDLELIKKEFNNHYSSQIQWYFKKQQVMICNIDKTPSNKLRFKKNILKYRHGNFFYFLHKYLLPKHSCDIGYKILAPINHDFNNPLIRMLIKYTGLIDTEIKVADKDLDKVIQFIKKYKRVLYACAIRYAKGDFFWVEIIIKKRHINLLDKLVDLGVFHTGKGKPKARVTRKPLLKHVDNSSPNG